MTSRATTDEGGVPTKTAGDTTTRAGSTRTGAVVVVGTPPSSVVALDTTTKHDNNKRDDDERSTHPGHESIVAETGGAPAEVSESVIGGRPSG